jgi:hypothetical protein
MRDEDLRQDLLKQAIELEREEREKNWNGSERRSIQVHILNYVDDRLKEHTERIEKVFHDHTGDEMQRYGEILNKIDAGQADSKKRHDDVMKILVNFNTKCKSVESAFLKKPDGTPDYEGHNYDHDKRKRVAEWRAKMKDSAVLKIVEWSSVGLTAWLLHTIWEATLKGPQ